MVTLPLPPRYGAWPRHLAAARQPIGEAAAR